MTMKLATELQLHGCECDPDTFENVLTEIMSSLYPGWGSVELEKRPSKGVLFCKAVRNRLQCRNLPEEMIMRRLSNLRKSGRETVPS